jgi:hypothetical protein
MINVALPKGRLGEQVYEMFREAGYDCPDLMEDSRKLFFENEEKGVRFFWVKPSDVAVYVGRGAADIGIAGKDILLEHQPDIYELLDLGLGKCRMMVAAPIKPNSSQMIVKIISFCTSGILPNFWMLSPRPCPVIPPEPIAYIPCMVWYASASKISGAAQPTIRRIQYFSGRLVMPLSIMYLCRSGRALKSAARAAVPSAKNAA